MNYRIPIFKLILKIIILIDNKEQKKINKIKKLIILSPYKNEILGYGKINEFDVFLKKSLKNIEVFHKNVDSADEKKRA